MDDLRMKAARVAGQAQLKDVRTTSLHADMDFPPTPGAHLSFEMSPDFEYALPQDEGELTVVLGRYAVSLSIDDGESEKREFAQLAFSLVALYDVPTPAGHTPFEPEEWEAFVQTTAQFALYPYARETISMLTSRLGVPQLTLGVLRVELNKEDVTAGQPS